jgi:hypothetical protein
VAAGVKGVLTDPQGNVATIAERCVILAPIFSAIRCLVLGISMGSFVGLRRALHRWLWVGHVQNMTSGSTGVKSRWGIRAPKPRRRCVGVKHQVVFGTRLAIEEVLARCGWTINTAFVERLTLDIRLRVAAIGRRVNTLCQGEAGLREQ